MDRRKPSLRKNFEVHLGYFLFKLWAFWATHLSLESLDFYGEKIGAIAHSLLRKRRKAALNNLRLALGKEKTEEEIKRICRDCFKNIGKDMMEISRCFDIENSLFKTFLKLEGRDHLDHALKEGKGVIALTGHFGNFPLMNVQLAKVGYPISIVARDPENPKVAKMITSFRDGIGMEFIPDKPRSTCVSKCLKALKKNRVLLMQIDQNAPSTETWVDFFGYLVPTFKGPVILSLRTGAPIIPMFIIRNPDSLQITIHPPFKLNITGDAQQDITSNIGQLTKIVEATIREYPEQWWWIHRRFKKARDPKTGERLFRKRP